MSTKVSQAQYTVAIVGATGDLGKYVTAVYLSDQYRTHFSKVIAVVRDPESPGARKLAEAGAELRRVDAANALSSFTRAFSGVDVVVNTVSNAPVRYHDALFDGALQSGVKVYFPSEFGLDYKYADLSGYGKSVWDEKARHVSRARKLAQNKVKIIELDVGMFIEYVLIPWFGFDATNLTFAFAGSPDSKITVTSKVDIARATARLSLLALSQDTAVPFEGVIRVAGQHVSYRQIADAVERVRGEFGIEPKKVTLKITDLGPYKATTREEEIRTGTPDLNKLIKILIGEGKVDYSRNNHNELVNPGEKLWKWKSVEDHLLYHWNYLFLHDSAIVGFDTKNLTYTAVGSLDAKTATTTKADIGRALAELSLLALSPELASQVPDDVHIAGDNVSYRDVQGIAHRVRDELGLNKGDIVLKSEDLEAYRATVREDQLKKPAPSPLRHIRILIAEGKMDFSKNHNELVNPGQKVWKWGTVEEFIRAKGSKFFDREDSSAKMQPSIEQLQLINVELQRRKVDAERDRDLFRDLYGKASAHAGEVSKENNELQERLVIAEGQGTYEERVRLLEAEVAKWKAQCELLVSRDQRTDDEVRRRAALEPELREENERLSHLLEALQKDYSRMEGELAALGEKEQPETDGVLPAPIVSTVHTATVAFM
ncbi:predicted protein [Postia placenta Mad-698-R]|nr:predicted protein [Postia placenta Mad-698-R]